MRKEIIAQLDGYETIIKDIAAARKYGNAFTTEKGAVDAFIRRLHPASLDLKVNRVIDETSSTKTLRLIAQNGYLPPFQAGQYITLFIETGGIATSRPYSISSPPNQTGFYDITVKRVKGGRVSNYLLDDIGPGDMLRSSGPCGTFHFNPVIHDRRMVCIAGGSGITPFMSMIREISDRGLSREIILFYGNPGPDDVIFHEALEALAAEWPNIIYIPVIENRNDGSDGATGYITGDLIVKTIGSVNNTTFFLCGPQAMYDFCTPELEQMGVPGRKIRREIYGEPRNIWEYPGWPPGVEKDQLFSVEVRGQGRLQAKAGETLLAALENSGVIVPTLCRSGECSMCRVKILSGKVFQPAGVPIRASDRQFGYTHSCVSYAVSDLKIMV